MALTFLTDKEAKKLPPCLTDGHLLFETSKVSRGDIEGIIGRTIPDLDDKYSDSVLIKVSFDRCIFCIYIELYFKYDVARIGGIYSVEWMSKYRRIIESELLKIINK